MLDDVDEEVSVSRATSPVPDFKSELPTAGSVMEALLGVVSLMVLRVRSRSTVGNLLQCWLGTILASERSVLDPSQWLLFLI